MGDLLAIRRRRPGAGPRERLWREALGGTLRDLRHDREKTITQVADRAGISAQYLSEVERGLKDPSSEIVAAVAGALETTVHELTILAVRELRVGQPATPSLRGPLALAA